MASASSALAMAPQAMVLSGHSARLVHFGRVDAVKADALAGNLDSVAVDYAGGACYFTERQDRPQDDRRGDQ